jgi:hypothetical protein
MVESLLLPLAKLSGSHPTSFTVRPHRIAYLVDPFDAGSALSAIEAACMEWGGRFQILVPCPPGGSPEAAWLRIRERHDPDYLVDLVDLVGASPVFCGDQRDRLGRAVRRWDRPRETMHLVGATLWAALSR